MGRESFTDPNVANLMNEHFINIKVDRDERPDLDKVYQITHQLLHRSAGGWPLTAFLDPTNQIPFFTGTYFPKNATPTLPGFKDLLAQIQTIFTDKRDELIAQGKQITEALEELSQPPRERSGSDQADRVQSISSRGADKDDDAAPVDYDTLAEAARDGLLSSSDRNHGGFGTGTKFHFASALHFLLQRWGYSDKADRDAFDVVMTSLTQMARGGIFDQLGGGFCHYATDKQWMIPHFEKTLYDNGALLRLYGNALRVGPDPLFEDLVQDTIGWLERDMQHPEGAFFAAQGADSPERSEDRTGAYYVWRKPEVKKALSEDEYLLVETLFGLDKPANCEGRWNLHRRESFRSATQRIFLETDDPHALLSSAKSKLLALRSQRTPPALDEKILAGWNGIAVDGLAACGLYLQQPHWIQLAQQSMDFVREEMMENNRLHASWINGQLGAVGFLDDYAFCLRGLLSLLQAEWREIDIQFAIRLADLALELFQADNGGFYFATKEGEPLIHQPQPSLDDTTESGNAALGCALYDLGQLLGKEKYIEAALGILAWAGPIAAKYPSGHSTMLELASRTQPRNQQVVLRGVIDEQWRAAVHAGYSPWRRVYTIGYEGMDTLPSYLPRMVSAEMRVAPSAYLYTVAQGCSEPIRSLDALQDALRV